MSLEIDMDLGDDAHVVRARGTLDRSSVPSLCRAIEAEARTLPPPPLVLDLAGLRHCDVACLRALAGAAREVEVRNGRLVVSVAAGSEPDRALARTGLVEFVHVARRPSAAP
jgi:anti-anti-sigma factor